MKILMLSSAPIGDISSGGGIRSNAIRSGLAKLGNVDTIIIQFDDHFRLDPAWGENRVREVTFDYSVSTLTRWSHRLRTRAWLGRILAQEKYDVIVVRYLSNVTLIPLAFFGRLYLDADDLIKIAQESTIGDRLRTAARNVAAKLLIRFPRHVWVVSSADARAARRSHRLSVLRNIAPESDTSSVTPPVVGRILMVGLLTYAPNIEGLRWFIKNVLPRLRSAFPTCHLHAVGRYGADFDGVATEGVTLLGFVDRLDDEYQRASLVIAPIREGGGTQIKVVEALLRGRPLLSSRFSYLGFSEHLCAGEDLAVAESVDDWVSEATRLLSDSDAAESMAQRGRTTAKSLYTADILEAEIRRTIKFSQ